MFIGRYNEEGMYKRHRTNLMDNTQNTWKHLKRVPLPIPVSFKFSNSPRMKLQKTTGPGLPILVIAVTLCRPNILADKCFALQPDHILHNKCGGYIKFVTTKDHSIGISGDIFTADPVICMSACIDMPDCGAYTTCASTDKCCVHEIEDVSAVISISGCTLQTMECCVACPQTPHPHPGNKDCFSFCFLTVGWFGN
ncbi:hypothetical protein D915_007481 [Fasciola hepatica]|uniref:Uncharacterized protein n=1 Tax=Fasciola hepatica TaxID=6192 RepID=A0A4E0R4U6_FASHE|nr:hypothetical protein D915_007481 [Fasciola hepatica]